MKPAIRTQVDDLTALYSTAIAIDCSNRPDMTRQEFKDETDVNKTIARFGGNTQMRQPLYGAMDYDMDLQQSLAAIKTAQAAINRLPEPIRTKYAHLHRFMQGAESGELNEDLAAYLADQNAKKDLTKKGPDATIPPDPKQE